MLGIGKRSPKPAASLADGNGAVIDKGSARAYCAGLVQACDADAFMTAMLASEPGRGDLLALYAFDAELARVAKLVSEPSLGALRLAWWRDALAGLYEGRPPEHPLLAALAQAIARTGLTHDDLDDMIAARECDLGDTPPADSDALLHHVGRTSGTLLAQAALVLGGDATAARAARHVGIGWGLATLLRVIPRHAARGRGLLPADMMRAAGLMSMDLAVPAQRTALAGVVSELADLAVRHLALARANLKRPPRALLPALLPGALAESYLAALRRARFDPFGANFERGALARRIKVLLRLAQCRF